MNKKQLINLKDCQDQIEKDIPILLTLFSKIEKSDQLTRGHIRVYSKTLQEWKTVQYSLQLQKNDGKTPTSTKHVLNHEFYCFWVSHRYPLKDVDYYCLVCKNENIRIFIKKNDLHTGMNYFKMDDQVIFSDGTRIWDFMGKRDETVNSNQKDIKEFLKSTWKDPKWMRDTSQSLWFIKTYKGTPQEFYTKSGLTQIYTDNRQLKYRYKKFRTTAVSINRNSDKSKWTKIAEGATPDVEYWVIKGELKATHKELEDSFLNRGRG
jgi:hypothetical protein